MRHGAGRVQVAWQGQPPGRRLSVTALPSCQGLVFNEKDIHDLLWPTAYKPCKLHYMLHTSIHVYMAILYTYCTSLYIRYMFLYIYICLHSSVQLSRIYVDIQRCYEALDLCRYKLEEAEGGSQVLGEGLLDLDGHRALCSSSLPRPPKAFFAVAFKHLCTSYI